ncbi:MAG: TolC family protein [Chlamydiae bacterium]|nr:TolC family protein [Chlamydiota bacterium]MBI3277986.1 TolC family protein [Chlamydiota bacterium]
MKFSKVFLSSSFAVLAFLSVLTYSAHAKFYGMDELVDRSIKVSQDLKLMDEDIERAQEELKVAKTAYWPKLSLQGNLGVDLFSLGSFELDRNAGSNLILDWNFFQNGWVTYRIEQAKAQVEISRLHRQSRELELAYQMKVLICEALQKEAELNLQLEEFQLIEKTREKAQVELRQERLRRADFLKTQVQFFDHKNLLEKLKREYQKLLQKLKERSDLSDMEGIDNPLGEEEQNPLSKEVLIDKALLHRVEIREAEIQWDLSRKAVKVAKLGRWPRLDLFAGNAFALDDLEREGDSFQFRTGVIARYPLYDGGEIKLQISLAEMAERKAQFQWKEAKRRVSEEVEEAYDEWMNAKVNLESGMQEKNFIQEEVGKAEAEFKKDRLSPYEWEEAQLNLKRSELRLLALRLEVWKAKARLAKGVGVGSH